MAHAHPIYDTNKRFVIDAATKNIAIVDTNKPVLVQYDNYSEVITFEIDRFVEGHDLSLSSKVEVHYNNIDLTGRRTSRGLYVAEDLKIDPDDEAKVLVSWFISEEATKYEGTLNFVVSFSCLDDGVFNVYRWNSHIGTLPVSAGINNTEYLEQNYADVLEMWKQDLFGIGDTEEARMLAIAHQQQLSIQEAGEKALANIPEDYSELQENINDAVTKTPIRFISGYNVTTKGRIGDTVEILPSEITSYSYAIVECEENDSILINGVGGDNPRLYCFLDKSNKILKISEAGLTLANEEVVAPSGTVKCIINSATYGLGECLHIYGRAVRGKNEAYECEEVLSEIDFISKHTIDRIYVQPEITFTNEYIDTMGGVMEHSTCILSGFIEVAGQGYIKCNNGYEFVVAVFDSNKNFISRNEWLTFYEITETGYIRISLREKYSPTTQTDTSISSNVKIYANTRFDRVENESNGVPIPFVSGYNITTAKSAGDYVDLTPNAISNYSYAIIDCSEGDGLRLTLEGGSNPRAWCFVDENNVVISVSPNVHVMNDDIITAPVGTKKCIINSITSKLGECKLYSANSLGAKNAETCNKIIASTGPYIGDPVCDDALSAYVNGLKFSDELQVHLADFAKDGDLMVHVSTFCIINGYYYVTYYANTRSSGEEPTEHTARFVYCPVNNTANKTYIDLCDIGDTIAGKTVSAIYDTVLLRKDDATLYLAWTAVLDGVYHRVYKTFDVATKTVSTDTYINTFTVGDVTVDFNTAGMISAFEQCGINHKPIDWDIGLMQKLTTRVENGVTYYYTGVYSSRFNCIVKSSDLINWIYVSQPTFYNDSQHENAVYVIGDTVYYFCRQLDSNRCGFLATYNLVENTWSKPVYIYDTQSRSDFFEYNGSLYLIHAPKDRNHLSVVYINTSNIAKSHTVQTAVVPDYFYPYVLNYNGELYISYTQSRKHIWLGKFGIKSVSDTAIANAFRIIFDESL